MGFLNTIENYWDEGVNKVESWGKTAENKVENTFNDVKGDVTKSYDNVLDVGKDAVKGIENGFGAVKQGFMNAEQGIENGFGYVKQGFESFEKTVQDDFKIVEEDAKVALNYGERIGKDLFNLLKLAGKSAEWLIDHYQIVLMGVGVYAGARMFNEVKEITK